MRLNEVRKSGLPVIDIATPIEVSNRGDEGVSVFAQDLTTPALSVPFLEERNTSTLASDALIDDRVINLSPGHGAVAGDIVELTLDGTSTFMQTKVISVNVDAVTIDQPINTNYTPVNSSILISSDSLQVDGSISPRVFSVLPLPGQSIDVTRMIIEITGSSAMDFEKIGSDPAVINGIVLRLKKEDGTFTNLFNFKSNGDFIRQAFDYEFQVNNANNVRAFTSRLTWAGQSKHGVVLRLDGDLGEELQVVVQDDLTGGDNLSFILQAQGHEVQK